MTKGGINELEKEAREKYHSHKTIDFQGFYNHHYYYLGYVESAEPREERIATLERENAESKLACKIQVDTAFQMIYEKDEQLSKAKEIIKKLLHTLENKDSEYTFALKPTHPVLVEAEQFIKEEETKSEVEK